MMHKQLEKSFTWRGRVDQEDVLYSRRLHQHVTHVEHSINFEGAPVLLGFSCDEGVKRNQGVAGAIEGPNAIRSSLANLACPSDYCFYDAGDMGCFDENLEDAQQKTANVITQILEEDGFPMVLGGGHEIGWASFLGAQQFLSSHAPKKRLGILNFDAHFDLRNPNPQPSSGTPFRQCQEWCQHHDVPFEYFVMGLNKTANTDALFYFAKKNNVRWIEDIDCHAGALAQLQLKLTDWLDSIDYLYVTVCLDVFPAAYAPGVSAPAGLGVEPTVIFKVLEYLQTEVKRQNKCILLADVAEMNPKKDTDNRTAKLAARYVHSMMI